GTVAGLKKLSETDTQLLKKYSKVYFLNENYAPASLSAIDAKYLNDKTEPELVHSGVLPYLTGMLEAAKRDGTELRILSAFRSFYEQKNIKSSLTVLYGAGTANQFSADQGYSEHQLGTTVDITTPEVAADFSLFEKSSAYTWLTANAYRFGFILSYPKNNTYYMFEPWHWRFVGVALATRLHDKNEYFYNLTQNEIDKYLISIFD
ncbi:MAG: M15 family metallopeptidase, partial [Candidatus Liptonbacteria bacterium]|nr:M15 family metallopeptidase [Candidatus Liptonbacteria bacterium]